MSAVEPFGVAPRGDLAGGENDGQRQEPEGSDQHEHDDHPIRQGNHASGGTSSAGRSAGAEKETLAADSRRMRLGFGCAGLMRLPSHRRRQQLLGAAFEQGLTRFDVARMYGLGMAEAELGRFAKGRREEIVIATKFGIEPGAPRLARLQAPARAAVAHLPGLRAALRRRSGAPHEPRRYDASAARSSLETSLRQLGTDYVDYFFVHDPAPGDLVDLEGLGELFGDLVQRGMVRAWGVSGDPDPCISLARAGAPVLQVRDEIFAPVAAPPGAPSTISFGVLARPLARIRRHLDSDPRRQARWRATVGCDCGNSEVLASLLLQDALERNPAGAVLFATTRRERIGPAVAAAEAASSGLDKAALAAFRSCVLGELGADGRVVA
jgi:D-threo-aldose 1-dehydrogenase